MTHSDAKILGEFHKQALHLHYCSTLKKLGVPKRGSSLKDFVINDKLLVTNPFGFSGVVGAGAKPSFA